MDILRTMHLFAGAGGGILADLLLGHRPVCAVEIEPYCRQVLLQRQRDGILPRFPIWDDVRTFDGTEWRGRVDVVCAGWPCQDISAAGKGAGLDGEQSGLFSEVIRIAMQVEPERLFLENSPMLTRRGLGTVLSQLAQLGYHARWCVLGADSAGFCHRRKRIWILAYTERYEQPREKPCDWSPRRVGGVVKPVSQNQPWESALSEFRGMDDGVARVVDRTDAIRNGQVPAVAALAWQILTEGLTV
jgi:DNA (cytosine-5)-methyltransferase 1